MTDRIALSPKEEAHLSALRVTALPERISLAAITGALSSLGIETDGLKAVMIDLSTSGRNAITVSYSKTVTTIDLDRRDPED